MSTGVDVYSTTPASNGTLGGTGYFPEGQAPSTVNDAARQVMADIAAWYGQAKTPRYLTGTAGTNTVTATGPASMAAYGAGQVFFFIPAATNTGATTLNITPSGAAALGAKNIFFRGAACAGGEILINVPVMVIYDGTQFNLQVTSLSSAASGSSMVLLGSKALSASATASFVHTGGSGDVIFDWTAYDEYEFHFVQVVPATNAVGLQAQISEDSGSTYKSGANTYSAYLRILNNTVNVLNASSSNGLNLSGDLATYSVSNGTDYGINGTVTLNKPSSTIKKTIRQYLTQNPAQGVGMHTIDGSHIYSGDTGAWTGIKFFFNSGNLASGTIYAYGIKRV